MTISLITYNSILENIKTTIKHTQFTAYRRANNELIKAYFHIGQIISEQIYNKRWGTHIVQKLSIDLKKEFGGQKGYSIQNLRYMKKFYQTYKDEQKIQQLVGELPRGHNVVIMDKCRSQEQREFYIQLTISKGLSRNVLIHQIESDAYTLAQQKGQNNFDLTLSKDSDLATQITKDDYVFDFMGLSEPFAEKKLEQSLLEHIKQFLMELGNDFCFIGNQYKLTLDGNNYFIDLLFYHRGLKRLFAIELKVEEFKPEFVGKMNFYLGLLDDLVKKESEESSIGILLCKKKNKLVVEYALRDSKKPIAVATYHIISSLEKRLKEL